MTTPDTESRTQEIRDRFELWLFAEGYSCAKNNAGKYWNDVTEWRWEAWQAATAGREVHIQPNDDCERRLRAWIGEPGDVIKLDESFLIALGKTFDQERADREARLATLEAERDAAQQERDEARLALTWAHGNADELATLLREFANWTEIDRHQDGPGPSGGRAIRARKARRAYDLGIAMLETNAQLQARAETAEARLARLEQALRDLVIDANRLCDRQLGGTYEDDARRSIERAQAALRPLEAPAETGRPG